MIDPNTKINIIELSEYNPEWSTMFTEAYTHMKGEFIEKMLRAPFTLSKISKSILAMRLNKIL